FKTRLEIIDAQSLDQIKSQFDTLAKEATKAFTAMEEGWFKAFLLGDKASQEGIRNVHDNFSVILKDIKEMEKAGNTAGIGKLLDDQIAKTKELIKTDQTWAGTAATKDIIAANQRLLTILG